MTNVQWLVANWRSVVGVPAPGDEWELGETPLPRSVIANLGKPTHLEEAGEVECSSNGRTWKQKSYRATEQLFADLARYSSLSESLIRELAVDPESDVRVLDLTGEDVVNRRVAHVEETVMIDVELLHVPPSEWGEDLAAVAPPVDVCVESQSMVVEGHVPADAVISPCASKVEWRRVLGSAAAQTPCEDESARESTVEQTRARVAPGQLSLSGDEIEAGDAGDDGDGLEEFHIERRARLLADGLGESQSRLEQFAD